MNRRVTLIVVLILLIGGVAGFLKYRPFSSQRPATDGKTQPRTGGVAEARSDAEKRHPDAEPPPQPVPLPEPAVFIGATDVSVPVFLRQLHKATGLNIVATGDLAGSVSSSLDGVDWSAALQTVLLGNKLQAEYRGSFVIIRQYRPSGSQNSNADFRLRPNGPSLSWQGEHRGKRIELESVQASPRKIFESLSALANWRLVLDQDIGDQVTIIGAAPWDEFFEALLEASNLDAELAGNTVHVMRAARINAVAESSAGVTGPGVVRCVIGFTMKESDDPARRAEYTFEVVADGRRGLIQLGPRVPVITAAQLGGPPTAQYIDALVRITVAVRLSPGLPREAWFMVDGEYSRPVEHSAGFSSKQSLPYLDTVMFNTDFGLQENNRLSFAGYKDLITGREFQIDFSWSTVVPSARTLPLRVNNEKIVAQVSYDIGGKSARYWLMMVPDLGKRQFRAGTRVPVVTPAQLNGPATVQYVDTFSSFNVDFQRQPVLRHRRQSLPSADLGCEYTRILNRPYATNSDNPYLDSGSFWGLARTNENQEELLTEQADPIENRNFKVKFKWWPVQN